ncbi:MAG: RNA polymerase subunit sigma-70, partial [Nannocystaceae bacterium]
MLTAEEERTVATRIQSLHVAVWRAICSYPPFVGGIAEHLVEIAEGLEEEPAALARTKLQSLKTAARAYRDRETRANKDRYHQTREEMAKAFAMIDVDGEHRERIIDSLQAVA